ncbi:MAG: hypothetical protein RTU92_00410 [Candidatus Thorarchaeota archaeon]
MQIRTFLCSLLILCSLFGQVGTLSSPDKQLVLNSAEPAVDSFGAAIHAGTIGEPFSTMLNTTTDRLQVHYNISEPSVVSYNFTLEGISAPSGVDLDIDVLKNERFYIPQLNDYSHETTQERQTSAQLVTDLTLSAADYVYASETGFLLFDFALTWYEISDIIRINITMIEHHRLADAVEFNPEDELTISLTTDDSHQSFRFTLDNDALYNMSQSSYLDYETPPGWTALAVNPLTGVLMDLNHGEIGRWSSISPSFYLSDGVHTGTEEYTQSSVLSLPKGECYLVLRTRQLEFLGEMNFTIKFERLETLSLSSNEQLELEFESGGDNEFLVEVNPEFYYMNDFYFNITHGANWSVSSLKYATTRTISSIEYFENGTSHYMKYLRLEKFVMIDADFGLVTTYPTPSLTGDQYRGSVLTYSSFIENDNGTIQKISIPTTVRNIFPKFYFTIIAEPIHPIHSSSFNVTLNLDSVLIPDISEGVTVLDFNLLTRPSYHFFKIPVQVGDIVEATITPTEFIADGGVLLQMFPDIQTQNNWHITYEPYLSWSESVEIVPYRVSTVEDPATLKIMAIADGYMVINVFSYSSYPSDLQEAELDIRLIESSEYTLGSSESCELRFDKMKGYRFNVVAGVQYQFDFELFGLEANAMFLNNLGVIPFKQSGFEPWVSLSVGYRSIVQQSIMYTANETGSVVLVLVGQGDVRFSITTIDLTIISVTTGEPFNTTLLNQAYEEGYNEGREFGMIIVGAGAGALIIIVIFLRRR